MMNSAIQVRGLKKSYGSGIVLNGLDFEIEKGETFALLGVNGAGKTTTLECIESLRKYDSGTITVSARKKNGGCIGKAASNRIGASSTITTQVIIK